MVLGGGDFRGGGKTHIFKQKMNKEGRKWKEGREKGRRKKKHIRSCTPTKKKHHNCELPGLSLLKTYVNKSTFTKQHLCHLEFSFKI